MPWEREKMKINNRIGKIGEKLAAEYLEKHGYEIITTNFYTYSILLFDTDVFV